MAARSIKSKARVPKEVFVSYSHHDRKYTIKLAADLRRHDVRVWFSERNIGGAQQWLAEIGKALKRCDWMIIVLTQKALKSPWVYDEVAYALGEKRYRKRVVPLIFKKCDPKKLVWALANVQAISAQPYEKALRNLLAIWGIDYRKS